MTNFSKIMALCEASTGFVGGNFVDEMPHLTLEECITQLPVSIVENHTALVESAAAENEALIEATISAIGTGSTSQVDYLVEMSFQDIKNKIIKVLDNIKKFLSSIVAKLTLQIDKIRMSGHQLYTKYADRPEYKNKTWKDLTISGYKFKGGDIFKATDSYVDAKSVKGLIVTCVGDKQCDPDEFVDTNKGIDADSADYKAKKKTVDTLNGTSAASAAHKMAEQLVSCKVTESSWESDIRKALGMDEKVEISFGKDGFDKTTIESLLKNPLDLTNIKEQYAKLRNSVEDFKKYLTDKVDANSKEIDKLGNVDESKNRSAALSLANAYYNAYLKYVNNAYGTISRVQSIRCKYEMARVNQAKAMFGKMLSWKEPKKDNNDASDIDFELEVEL